MKLWHEVEEAKTRFCPMSMNGDQSGLSCIADKCMAWRWVRTHINNPENPSGDLIPSHDTHGFCGMAGIPNDKA